MSRAHATREIWHPKSTEEKAAVLRELETILSSPQFRNSKRYPALLEYIVKNTLAGRSDQLRSAPWAWKSLTGRPHTTRTPTP